jgi:hypothetical protein
VKIYMRQVARWVTSREPQFRVECEIGYLCVTIKKRHSGKQLHIPHQTCIQLPTVE